MSSPTNVLNLGIRVEDREANRAIGGINKNFEALSKTGVNAGFEASKSLGTVDEIAKVLVSRLGGLVAVGATVKKAIDFGVDSAQYAAKTQMFGIALQAVGKNAGYTKQELDAVTDATAKLGITRQVAQKSIARLVGNEIDLANATKLTRASQDLSRVAAISGSEALERLTHAVVTQQPELFRTMGLNVNLQREFQKTAHASGRTAESLSQQEKSMITLKAALAGAARFQGTYEKAAETAGGRTLSLDRRIDNLKDSFGQKLQPALIATIDTLERLIEVSDRAFHGKQGGLFTTGEVDPLFAPGVNINDLTRAVEQQSEANRVNRAAVNIAEARDVMGKSLIANEERLKQVRESLPKNSGSNGSPYNQSAESLAAPLFRKSNAEAEARFEQRYAFREKLSERTAKAIEETRKVLQDAQLSELSGLERINAERQIALRQYRLTTDEIRQMRDAFDTGGEAAAEEVASLKAEFSRVQREHGSAIANLNRAFDTRERQEREKITRAVSGAQRYVFNEAVEQIKELQRLRNSAFLNDLQLEHDRLNFSRRTQEEALDAARTNSDLARDYDLSKLQLGADDSLRSKIYVEQESLKIYRRSLDEQLQMAIAAARLRADIEIWENPRFREQIEMRLEQTKLQLRERTALESRDLEMRSTVRVAEFQRDEYRRVWGDVKRSAEGVFDSLTSRSRSFAEYWKTLFLTGLKEIVTSQVATIYLSMFGGGGRGGGYPGIQGAATSRGGGGLGALLGLPSLGGIGRQGAPGGTGGFSGPVGGFAGGSGSNGLRGLLGIGGFGGVGSTSGATTGAGGWKSMLAAQGAGAKGLLTSLGNLGRTPVYDMWGVKGMAGKGVGGMGGGAMLLGGGALAAAGLQRGGWSGMGMTAAGGALIGMKFGGPMGAVIGGAIGAGAGLIRMLFKGAEKKTAEKIKSIYGLDVKDKGILRQVVETAKSTYGGNTDVAIRSPQIRELLELYAMSTGQKFGLNKDTVRPFVASQSGGSIFQQVQFDSGRAFIQQSSLATANGGGKNVFYFDGPALTKIMAGEAVEVIANEPRAVQAASTRAAKGNYQRRESWIQGIAPHQITQ